VEQGRLGDSQVFDHTSLIRFIETRFAGEHPDLIETNITPWRRAGLATLRRRSPLPRLMPRWCICRAPQATCAGQGAANPTTWLCRRDSDPARAGVGSAAGARVAVRIGCAWSRSILSGSYRIDFSNTGEASAVFMCAPAPGHAPRSYTVEPGKSLSGKWR